MINSEGSKILEQKVKKEIKIVQDKIKEFDNKETSQKIPNGK